jgi:hypothetical protein
MSNKGGLIFHASAKNIANTKNKNQYPPQAMKIINFLKIPNSKNIVSNIFIFGSYALRVQPYYSDIDTINQVTIDAPEDESIAIFYDKFKKILLKLNRTRGWFFTDVKAGIYDNGEPVHWRLDEILDGKRDNKPDYNGNYGHKNFLDAVKDTALLKLDIVVPYFNRYIEATVVYYLKSLEKYIGYSEQYFTIDGIISSLLLDTKKQLKKNKIFKAIKRIFAYYRLTSNKKNLEKLYPIITSNISKLSSIGSDLSTIKLLLELNKPIDKLFTSNELYIVIDKIPNMIDLNFDHNFMIDEIIKIKNLINENKNSDAINLLNNVISNIMNITNAETIEYLNYINFDPFEIVIN